MDNERVVHVSNKQAAKETEILGLLRAIDLICLMNNIFFRARHIQEVKNALADSLCIGVWIQHQPRELGNTQAQLLEASLSATSLKMYPRPWQIRQHFKREYLKLQTPLFPISINTLAPFIVFLTEQKYAAYSCRLHISTRLS